MSRQRGDKNLNKISTVFVGADLGGEGLVAGVLEWNPVITVERSAGDKGEGEEVVQIRGLSVDLVGILAERLNFRCVPRYSQRNTQDK